MHITVLNTFIFIL